MICLYLYCKKESQDVGIDDSQTKEQYSSKHFVFFQLYADVSMHVHSRHTHSTNIYLYT